MNRKSILGIFLILIALSLTLGAVSAEEVVGDDAPADSILSADESVAEEPQTSESGSAAGENVTASAESNQTNGTSADLMVKVTPFDYGKYIIWSVIVYNAGPDTAVNTRVTVNGTDNLYLADYLAEDGEYDLETLIWYVGDLPANYYTELLLATIKYGPGPYYVYAFAESDTFDPDISNNYDIAVVDDSNAPVKETLPSTGNPLAVALLALIAIGVGGIKRRL